LGFAHQGRGLRKVKPWPSKGEGVGFANRAEQ